MIGEFLEPESGWYITFRLVSAMSEKKGTGPVTLIASPVPSRRRRWRQALQGNCIILEVSERTALERSMGTLQPAMLLLDLSLPKLGELRGVPTIQRLCPSAKILLLTSNSAVKGGIAMLESGAKGFCHHNTKPFFLRKAVTRIQRGEIWLGRKVISRLIEKLASASERHHKKNADEPDNQLDHLTPREREIVSLVAEGNSNKEIADNLQVAEKTVKAHLTTIFRKVGQPDRLRLALYANARR